MLSRPDAMPAAFAGAWNDRDAGTLAALFSEDAGFVNVVGLVFRGREAIFRAHDYGLGTFFGETVLRVGRVDLRMAGDRAAIVRARVHLTGQTDPDGAPAGDRQGWITFVMECAATGWICIAAQNTDIVSGAETLLAGDDLSGVDYRT